MFRTIAIVLLVAWILGFGVFHTAGMMIHLLLIFAVASIIWHLMSGKHPLI